MKIRCFLAVLLPCLGCLAQKPAPRLKECERPAVNYGNWIGRLALSEDFAKKIGLTAEQSETLKTALTEVDNQGRELEKKIRENARKQVALYEETLTRPGAKGDKIFALADKIGKYRTEQAKLSIKTLLIIRDTLDENQRKKAHTLIRNAGRKRMLERRRQRATRDACPVNKRNSISPRARSPAL